jgi:O-antigen/teichoic acid export membrane protein
MEEIDLDLITKRSIRGIFALTSRTFIIQIVAFISNFLLTVFLTPAIFGVYFVVTAAIAFLQYFSDIGLAAALIQKKESITEEDLKTTFTIQQAMVVTVTLVAIFASGWIGKFYNLGMDGVFLFQALAIAFFLSSLKTIPSIILERNLRFEKLVIPQIVETFVFSVTVVVLAIKGFGISSFTYSVLARGIAGLIAIYIISPWKIGFGFSKTSAKKLLAFGLPFQLNSFLALIKDDLFIAYLGKALPLAQLGYIGFAQKWAFVPLRLIMDNVIRITFPSFSRLQDEAQILKKAIEKSIFAASFLIFPALVGLVSLAPYFIKLIPKYEKWEPAVISLGFFALSGALSSVSTPLTNALNAIGKIKTTLYLMIFWTASTWVLTPILIKIYGFNGVSIASFIIACSLIFVIFIVKKHIDFNLTKSILSPLISSLVMGLVIYFLSPIFIHGLITLFLMIIIGMVSYFAIIFLIARKEVVTDVKLVLSHLKK